MNAVLQSETLFRLHFVGWRILGLLPTKRYRQLYVAYAVFINTIITIGYPLHLMIGLFMSSTMYEIIKNLSVTLTCLVCSVKIFMFWLKFQNVQTIMDIIKSQDQRIGLSKAEVHYHKSVVFRSSRLLFKIFVRFYASSAVFSEMLVLSYGFRGSWNLMFPGYFPYDPIASTTFYIVAHAYQFIGLSFQVVQGIINDSFTAMNLAFLSGHLRTLNMRVAKLGTNKDKTSSEHQQELLKCIEDHQELLRYRCKLEEVISLYMFCQILATSINMCTIVVLVIFFDNNIFAVLYYSILFLSITLQLFPICYYGTIVQNEFQNLTYALYTSNWLEQNKNFKQSLGIFIESTMKPLYIKAWLFPINLNLFSSVCKNAYSLFALIMNIK